MDKMNFKLSEFEGPLDLLLFLISKHKLNILDIEISELLRQYMEFIHSQPKEDLDLKSEFLQMASRLLHIKTVMLLPKHEEEADELKERLSGELMEYSICRQAAKKLEELAQENTVFVRKPMEIEGGYTYKVLHDVSLLKEAVECSQGRLKRLSPPSEESFTPLVRKKFVSVESRIVFLLGIFYKESVISFERVFSGSQDKSEIVATFLALLELIKGKRIMISQDGTHFFFKDPTQNKSENKILQYI